MRFGPGGTIERGTGLEPKGQCAGRIKPNPNASDVFNQFE